jgi:hypothetical protein
MDALMTQHSQQNPLERICFHFCKNLALKHVYDYHLLALKKKWSLTPSILN